MCGIAGVVNWGDREVLSRMIEVQAHRGPDDEGSWEYVFPDGTYAGLGSRRLAILDLSPAGHMPMSNAEGTIWIAYNGEIYNFLELRRELEAKGHTFRTKTDTEVVLRLYEEEGPDCVKRLDGMFAFGLWDLRPSVSPCLLIARDHFGVKPLYYMHRGERFAFASEVKALLQVPDFQTEVDSEALHQFLTLLWVPDPRTMFRGVVKLPAGHYGVFRNGALDIVQYWDLSMPPSGAAYPRSEHELAEEARELFRQSVGAQMISDVPVGAFLSAGLDSSSIVAMMSQTTSEPVRTYTITFPPKYRVGQTTLDDPAVASRLAQRFGCDHHEIVVEPQVHELLPRLIWHMDEPVADPAIISAYLVCKEARRTSTVLLSGVGGDELFAGYRKHSAHYWAQAYKKLPRALRHRLIEPLVSRLPTFRGTPLSGLMRLSKKMGRSASLSSQDRFLMNCTYMNGEERQALCTPEWQARLDGLDAWERHRRYFENVKEADFLNQMLYLDLKAFMVTLNLTYNDKMSMASSVEVRVPFLNRKLAEFVAWQVPPSLKLNGPMRNKTKYIFRRAMEGILPREILRQPKAGFGIPVDYWLANDLKDMVDDLLSPERTRSRGYFDATVVRRLVEEQRSGLQDWSMQIWQLLTFELWLQTFVDRPAAELSAARAPRPVS